MIVATITSGLGLLEVVVAGWAVATIVAVIAGRGL